MAHEKKEGITFGKVMNAWRCLAVVVLLLCVALLIALIVVIVVYEEKLDDLRESSAPCPPASKGGLMTSGDPPKPSPFHDITRAEYDRVYAFLLTQDKLNIKGPVVDEVNASTIFMMDLLLPSKRAVLSFVDGQGDQPPRQARVMIFRGDLATPLVQEYRVGPLSKPTFAELIVNPQRTNPVDFNIRPMGNIEGNAIYRHLLPEVDRKVGHVLRESYEGTFTDCGDDCLLLYQAPVGTNILKDSIRRAWYIACYDVEYYTMHPLDFGLLLDVQGSDVSAWRVDKVWYAGNLFQSLDDLALRYNQSSSAINKTRVQYVRNTPDLTSTQRLRGDPVPETPQRPPLQTEPDGKRYTINHRHVKYLNWEFHFRLSAFTGPQTYDIRFKGERIAYELGLSEISVFYAGFNPMQSTTNFVDSGALIGTHSKSLIPGVDCPEHATFLNASFFGESMDKPTELTRAQCVFEQNTGVPLRRHMSYGQNQGGFYGGMVDSVLVVRSILTIVNYDYIVDYIFHQSGAIEARAISTGYVMGTFYSGPEAPYSFQLTDTMGATLHHHMFHFKADLDLGGTSNRYETLDITEETVPVNWRPGTDYRQLRFDRHLYRTEEEAVYRFNFDRPRYHLVHNQQRTTKHGAPRAFRLHMSGMSKQLLTQGQDNEKTIPWARQQLAVTVHSENEGVSSSPYAMFDSFNPVTDFSNYIGNESIVDQDLVFWVTLGTHHIPHTEDIPVTPTAGNHLAFFLLPYNYFPECPSVSSRDNVRVEYVNAARPSDGLKVEKNGNPQTDQCGLQTLEQVAKDDPDQILHTHREFTLF